MTILRTRSIPCVQNNPPTVRVSFDLVDNRLELVNTLALVVGVPVLVLSPEVTPLEAIHGTEIALFPVSEAKLVQKCARAIGVPNFDDLILELVCVGAAADEPE